MVTSSAPSSGCAQVSSWRIVYSSPRNFRATPGSSREDCWVSTTVANPSAPSGVTVTSYESAPAWAATFSRNAASPSIA